MRIKHILVTSLNRWLKPGTLFSWGLDNDWLLARWAIFEKYTLPSVAGQTVHDFDWVILCHEESPAWLRERARALQLPCRVRFSFRKKDPALNDLAGEQWDVVLTTRIDSDDAWHHTALERIRESFAADPNGCEMLNFEVGYWYDSLRKRLALAKMPSPPFNTLVKYAPVTNPLYLGGSHTKLRERYAYREISRGDPLFVRVLHSANIESRLDRKVTYAPYLDSQYILEEAFNITDPFPDRPVVPDGNCERSRANGSPGISYLLEHIAAESETLQLLYRDPEGVKARYNLNDEEVRMLRSVDLLSPDGIDQQ